MKRVAIAIAIGIAVSLALFWLMQLMISKNPKRFKDTENLQMTEFIRLKRVTKDTRTVRKIPEKPPKKKPPPAKAKMQVQQNKVKTIQPKMDVPKLDVPLQTDRFSRSFMQGITMRPGAISNISGEFSGNVIPLVRIAPRYPMRAAKRRIEGWVKVEFTITKSGSVSNASVVEAQPSSIFNREALNAIRKWKFKEKQVGGIAVEQKAIQVLEFKLTK